MYGGQQRLDVYELFKAIKDGKDPIIHDDSTSGWNK